jgi:streptogrisin B
LIKLITTAALAASFTLPLSSAQVGAAGPGAEAPAADIAWLEQTYHLSEPAAQDRLHAQDAASRVADALAAAGRLAGARIDLSTGKATFFVTAAGATAQASDRADARALPRSEVVVARSMQELETEASAIASYNDAHLVERSGLIGTSIDLDNNAIVVHVSDALTEWDSYRDGLLKAFPDVSVERGATQFKPAACDPRTCGAPSRGGIESFNSYTRNSCSAAFNVHSGASSYLLTSAHCHNGAPVGTNFTHMMTDGLQHTIGPRQSGVFSGDTDAMTLKYVNEAGWNPQPWVIYNPVGGAQTDQLSISNTPYSNGELVSGMLLCRSGFETASTCGTIVGFGYSYSDGVGHTVTNQVNVSACANEGDSGGPVFNYSSGKAAGILGARSNTAYCFAGGPNNGTTYLFTRISSALSGLGVSMGPSTSA